MPQLSADYSTARSAEPPALQSHLPYTTPGAYPIRHSVLSCPRPRTTLSALRLLLALLVGASVGAAPGRAPQAGARVPSRSSVYDRHYAPPEGYPGWVEVPVLTPAQIAALVPTIVIAPDTPSYGSLITNAPAGSVIVLEDGTYTLSSTICLPLNGAAGAPITIVARHRGQAVIDAANVREAFNPYGEPGPCVTHYVRMVGLKIINGQRSGVYLQYGASHHLTIQDCEIAGTGVAAESAGVYVAAGDCLLISGCNLHDNGDGIRLGIKDVSFMTHVLVEDTVLDNNDIGSSNSDGVGMENALSSDIFIRDVQSSNHVDAGLDLKPRTTVVRCTSHHNSIGIKAWRSVAIANCLTHDNSYTAVNLAGLGSADVLIEGSTCVEPNWAMVAATVLNSLTIQNCIFAAQRNNPGGAATTRISRNLFVPPLTALGSEARSGDAGFVNALTGDYHLLGTSPAVGIGGDEDSLPLMAYDLDCTRRAAPYDAGAYNAAKIELPAIGAPGWLTGDLADSGVLLRWVAPTEVAGGAITDYLVAYRASTETAWAPWPHPASPATCAAITGLTYGVTYDFRVSAVTTRGTGPHSAAVSVLVCTRPNPPTIGAAVYPGVTGQATVAFSPPGFDGGTPITSYTVTSTPGAISATGTASPITVSGLTDGVPYTFTVRATNSYGASAESAPSNAVTPLATVPDAPLMLRATPGDACAVVTFMPPASDGGQPVTGYTVVASPGGLSASGAASPITVPGLTNGASYTFCVRATNSVGDSAASAVSNACTPTPGLAAPTEGLIAEYRFETAGPTAEDASGHGKHGVAHGTTVVPGLVGNGYEFDGVSSYVALAPGDDSYFARPSMTIALWFRQRGAAEGVLFSDGRSWSNYDCQVNTYQLLSKGSALAFDWRNNPTRYEGLVYSSAPAISDAKWHQAIVSWHPAGVSLYLDGVLVGSHATPPSGAANSRATAVGARDYVDAMQGFFAGVIDEVKVWDWAFTAPDAARLYEAERPLAEPASVTVTPARPTTADDLVAAASGGASAGTATSTYEWSQSTDGGASWGAWGASGATLDAGRTAKGELWKARARNVSGAACSAWVESAPVTIIDTPPLPPTRLRIEPPVAAPASLTATASGASDVDGDAITYACQWRRNGGGSWSTWGDAAPVPGSAQTGEQCQARAKAVAASSESGWLETVPVTIADTAPTVATSVVITPLRPRTGAGLTVSVDGATDTDCADTVRYECQWACCPVGEGWGAWGYEGSSLDSSLTTRGQQWKARARAWDGMLYGPWAESLPVTIQDTPPAKPSLVEVRPARPTAGTALSGYAKGGSDADADAVVYRFQWRRSTDGGVTWGAWGESKRVLPAVTAKGEQWQVRARSVAGTAVSGWLASEPAIVRAGFPNAPASVAVTPERPGDVHALAATASAVTGRAGDVVSYVYEWRNSSDGGKTWSAWGHPGRVITADLTAPGEQWQARGRARAGTPVRTSPWTESPVVTVASAPAASVTVGLAASSAPVRNGSVQITLTLATAASIAVRVLNPSGREVAVLPERSLAAGVQTLLWNGRSTRGTRVPRGQYVLCIAARGDSGSQGHAVAPVAW